MTAALIAQLRVRLGAFRAALIVIVATLGLLTGALVVHSSAIGDLGDLGAATSVTGPADSATSPEAFTLTAQVDARFVDTVAGCALVALGCALLLVLFVRRVLNRPLEWFVDLVRRGSAFRLTAPPLPMLSAPMRLELCVSRT